MKAKESHQGIRSTSPEPPPERPSVGVARAGEGTLEPTAARLACLLSGDA